MKKVFSATETAKAAAIVNVFETSRPAGDPTAVSVLDDAAGISYGIKQFTHRSGSLATVVERYIANGGTIERKTLEGRLAKLNDTSLRSVERLSADKTLKDALKAAGETSEMRAAQTEVAFEKYMRPALAICRNYGFRFVLSLAVIHDSVVHGSWTKIRDAVGTPDNTGTLSVEKKWIERYVRERDAWLGRSPRLRKTRYRTRFFIEQIERGNWNLDLPLIAHGVKLTGDVVEESQRAADDNYKNTGPEQGELNFVQDLAAGNAEIPDIEPPDPASEPSENSTPEDSRPPDKQTPLDTLERCVDHAAAKYDRVEGLVTKVTQRSDSAKSLWTTVAGTLWQATWDVAGILAGIPREVWLVVAVIAGALMLFYLYRQITLGRIREERIGGEKYA